jgi:predicted membrane GTPase involved in stress response
MNDSPFAGHEGRFVTGRQIGYPKESWEDEE